MKWSEVMNNSVLSGLPFKVELNEYGQILLSSISNKRSVLKSEIGVWLCRMSENGCAINNCSIETKKGMRVADVAGC
jgi:hypothetical protein